MKVVGLGNVDRHKVFPLKDVQYVEAIKDSFYVKLRGLKKRFSIIQSDYDLIIQLWTEK